MGVVSRARMVLASSVAKEALVAGAGVALVAMAVVERMKTFVGSWASLRVVDGSVGSSGCWHMPMDRRWPIEELAVVVCVDLLGIHYLTSFRPVAHSPCYCGHRQVELWFCSSQLQPQRPRIECVGPTKVLSLQ